MHYFERAQAPLTVRQLIDWTEQLVNALHPDHGIEYWSPAGGISMSSRSLPGTLGEHESLPRVIRKICVVPSPGANEGVRLDVMILVPDGDKYCWLELFGAKAFMTEKHLWAIAQTVSKALTELLWYDERSIVPELWRKVPRPSGSSRREPCPDALHGPVSVRVHEQDSHCFVVVSYQGKELDNHEFTGLNASLYAQAYAKDWLSIIERQKLATARVSNMEQHGSDAQGTVGRIVEFNVSDVLEYDDPEQTAEWQWVQQHASHVHRQNNVEPGVWEFMVNVKTVESLPESEIPDRLRAAVRQAREHHAAYLLFHQGC